MEEKKKPQANNKETHRFLSSGMITLIISVILIGLCVLGIMMFHVGCSAQTTQEDLTANHVFVFMGDGMGVNHVAATRYMEMYEQELPETAALWSNNSFDSFPYVGLMSTHNAEVNITDSAASATAMFSGRKTENCVLNCDLQTGERFEPLARTLSEAGYAVGVISTASLDHASPAAIYAVSEDRYDYVNIAQQGIECGWLDFWAAGGFAQQQEDREAAAADAGFTIAKTPDEVRALNSSAMPVLVATADDDAFPFMAYEIDRSRRAYYGADTVSFGDIVKKAVECFDEEEQFFVFAEAAKVDIASSMLDLKSALYEVRALDDAVAVALEFYENNPEDTLIVVLSDHETGGLQLRTNMNYGALTDQVASAVRFSSIMEDLYDEEASFSQAMENAEHYFGVSEDKLTEEEWETLERAYENTLENHDSEDDEDLFTAALCEWKRNKAKVNFVSPSHTAQPVPVYAIGKGAEHFAGLYDNTEIYAKLKQVTGIAG